MDPNKVKLEICGSSYVVSTNDAEEYLLGLAERLDRDMNQIMIDTPNASVTAAAVITALAYLDEAEKSAFGADNMRGQIQGYLEDAARARLAAEEARRDVQRLQNELAHYKGLASRQQKKQEPLLNYGQPPNGPPSAQAQVPPQMPPVVKPAVPVREPELEGQLDLDDAHK